MSRFCHRKHRLSQMDFQQYLWKSVKSVAFFIIKCVSPVTKKTRLFFDTFILKSKDYETCVNNDCYINL